MSLSLPLETMLQILIGQREETDPGVACMHWEWLAGAVEAGEEAPGKNEVPLLRPLSESWFPLKLDPYTALAPSHGSWARRHFSPLCLVSENIPTPLPQLPSDITEGGDSRRCKG